MRNRFLLFAFFMVAIISCTSVSRINDYSTTALKSLKKYEEIHYTFEKACRDKCYLEQIKNFSLTDAGCGCDNEYRADSVTSGMYNAIKGYYDGLVKLSSDQVATYKVQALAKELKSGDFGGLHIDKVTVDAYHKLSSVLLKAFANGYRSKKLKGFLEDANEPVMILLQALEANLASNLMGKLNIQKERLRIVYSNFLADSSASSYEKKNIIDAYHQHLDDVNLQQKKLLSFSKGLNSIQRGHQKLFDNRNKIKSREMKDILAEYAAELEDILSAFNKIKNK